MLPKLTWFHFKKIITLIVIANIVFLITTWRSYNVILHSNHTEIFLKNQLNLATENVVAVWYSSMILCLVAIMCSLCFFLDMERVHFSKTSKLVSYGWLILSLAFFTLSFDEMGSFHETIGESALFKSLEGSSSSGWGAFYVLIILVGVFMTLFSWLRLRKPLSAGVFMVLGIIFFLSNPIQENFEISSWQNSPNPAAWHRPVFYLLLEEGSEVFGTFCFFISTVIYYSYTIKKIQHKNVTVSAAKIKFTGTRILIAVLAGMVVLMVLIDVMVKRNVSTDVGIPKNWFPAVLAFIGSLCSFYIFLNSTKNRIAYLFLSILSLVISMYCGSDIYHVNFKKMGLAKHAIEILLCCAAAGIGFIFFMDANKMTNKICMALWVIAVALAFTLAKLYAAELLFLGFVFISVPLFQQLEEVGTMRTNAV